MVEVGMVTGSGIEIDQVFFETCPIPGVRDLATKSGL
jgi:hypothetical protein